MNYASKSGWSSIKEMNSPCNLISYGSLLCWAAESNCPWKEIYLQYVLAVWNGIAIWSAHTATPPSPLPQTPPPPPLPVPLYPPPHARPCPQAPGGFSKSHVCRLQKKTTKCSCLLAVFWRWNIVRITKSVGRMDADGKRFSKAIGWPYPSLSEKKTVGNAN